MPRVARRIADPGTAVVAAAAPPAAAAEVDVRPVDAGLRFDRYHPARPGGPGVPSPALGPRALLDSHLARRLTAQLRTDAAEEPRRHDCTSPMAFSSASTSWGCRLCLSTPKISSSSLLVPWQPKHGVS